MVLFSNFSLVSYGFFKQTVANCLFPTVVGTIIEIFIIERAATSVTWLDEMLIECLQNAGSMIYLRQTSNPLSRTFLSYGDDGLFQVVEIQCVIHLDH